MREVGHRDELRALKVTDEEGKVRAPLGAEEAYYSTGISHGHFQQAPLVEAN